MDIAISAVKVALHGIRNCLSLLSHYDGREGNRPNIDSVLDAYGDLYGDLYLLEDKLTTGPLEAPTSPQVADWIESCRNGLVDAEKQLNEHFVQIQELLGQQSSSWRRIVNQLSPFVWSTHESVRKRHEPNTGNWLVQSAEYSDWKAGRRRHLWVCGRAGCGKTVLCSTVIENLKPLRDTRFGKVGLGAFYFKLSDPRTHTYKYLLECLVAQLAWKRDSFYALQRANVGSPSSRVGEDELEDILLSAIRAYDQVFLALDALDEIPEHDGVRERILERLGKLVHTSSNAQILATSRYARDLQDSMTMINAERIDVASTNVQNDIQTYIASQLSRDPRLARLSDATKLMIKDQLTTPADGMFRWAYCQVSELKKLKSMKPKHIKAILEEDPPTLDANTLRYKFRSF